MTLCRCPVEVQGFFPLLVWLRTCQYPTPAAGQPRYSPAIVSLRHCVYVTLCKQFRSVTVSLCTAQDFLPLLGRKNLSVPHFCTRAAEALHHGAQVVLAAAPLLVHQYNASYTARRDSSGYGNNSTVQKSVEGVPGSEGGSGVPSDPPRDSAGPTAVAASQREKIKEESSHFGVAGKIVKTSPNLGGVWPSGEEPVPGLELVPVLDALFLLFQQIPKGFKGSKFKGFFGTLFDHILPLCAGPEFEAQKVKELGSLGKGAGEHENADGQGEGSTKWGGAGGMSFDSNGNAEHDSKGGRAHHAAKGAPSGVPSDVPYGVPSGTSGDEESPASLELLSKYGSSLEDAHKSRDCRGFVQLPYVVAAVDECLMRNKK